MVRRRSSRQFLVARSRCTKFRDARYFIPDEICTDMWRRSDRLEGGRRKKRGWGGEHVGMLTCVNIINSEYDILTWLKGCCWRVSACSRSPAVKGTCWGLRSPCIRSPCTAGRTTRTHTAAGWCWGRSDETWSLFPSGSHSWPTDTQMEGEERTHYQVWPGTFTCFTLF